MRLAATLFLAALGSACASLPDPVERFYRGDYEGAAAGFAERAHAVDRSFALHQNDYATAALCAGDLRDARRAFLEAGQVMGNFDGSATRELAALIGSESLKVWKGDPYEKAMNSFYAGLLFFRDGQYDNALAGCKNGLLADGDSKDENAQSDFTLLHLMEGLCQRRLGRPDEAARAFALARASLEGRSSNAGLEPVIRGDWNTVLVIGLGAGPVKYRDGPHGSWARFAPAGYPERAVRVSVDGAAPTAAAQAADLFFQASTRGGRPMDHILAGKAVLKDALLASGTVLLASGLETPHSGQSNALVIAGGVALLVGALLTPQADVRHWETLPGEVHLWAGWLEPGTHTLRLEFEDGGGYALPSLTQYWHHVPVRGRGENVYCFRAAGTPPPRCPPPRESHGGLSVGFSVSR